MLHVFEQPQLSVSPLGEEFGLEGPVKLLDGHLRPQPAIPRRTEIDEQTGDNDIMLGFYRADILTSL